MNQIDKQIYDTYIMVSYEVYKRKKLIEVYK